MSQVKLKKFKEQKPAVYSDDKAIYIGREKDLIYIGGPHYFQHEQIHLTEPQFLWLLKQMQKMVGK